MARVNLNAVKFTVATAQGYAAKVLRDAANERAGQVFEEAVLTLQEDFETHDVTREIEGGITSPNITQTLEGGKPPKSLYAFIGFEAGSTPTSEIREALSPQDADGPKLSGPVKKVVNGNVRFSYEVKPPNVQGIYKRTPMPWASGWSWVQKIETRIPGFAHFLSKFMGDPSRSYGGVQAKDGSGNLIEVRDAEYQPPEGGYLSGIINRFRATVRGYSKGGLKRRFK